MKKVLIVIGVVLVVLLILLVGWKFTHKKQAVPVQPEPGVSFPAASSTGGSTSVDGTRVRDFLHNGQTVPDPANQGNYLLAGSLDYCTPDMDCTAGNETEYNILFDSTSNAFTIALLEEPIGQVRRDAEQFLMADLGITQDQMCQLRAYVGTSYTVNESFTGRNLGFSFCPGAVKLP